MNQAEQMLHRVSPEGRALAHRDRVERRRRVNKQLVMIVLLAAAICLALLALGAVGISLEMPVIALAAAVFLGGCSWILIQTSRRQTSPAALAKAPLGLLPAQTAQWLEQQRGNLPGAALALSDALTRQLFELGPQLAPIENDGPGAQAVRKLIAVELPDLIERYRNVPPSQSRGDATSQLVQGLGIIESEIGRLSSDLAAGSFDALATQNRYLQLKYDAGLSGS